MKDAARQLFGFVVTKTIVNSNGHLESLLYAIVVSKFKSMRAHCNDHQLS